MPKISPPGARPHLILTTAPSGHALIDPGAQSVFSALGPTLSTEVVGM